MRVLLALCYVLALPLAAHPLDDKAEMVSHLRLLPGRIELAMEFRYKDAVASYTEFANGLDRNRDGRVTLTEIRQRHLDLADEVGLSISVLLNGRPLVLEPDLARFEFADLENPDAEIGETGIATHSSRIFYRFVFAAPADPGPGAHEVAYLLTGAQSVVHNPALQMLPWLGDAPIEQARWDNETGMPRLRVPWRITAPERPAAAPLPTPPVSPRGLWQAPRWLPLTLAITLLGAGGLMLTRRGARLAGLAAIGAGVLVTLASMLRLGTG